MRSTESGMKYCRYENHPTSGHGRPPSSDITDCQSFTTSIGQRSPSISSGRKFTSHLRALSDLLEWER
ncbi:hypothetical protein VTN49DRAFT_4348 [Thermomyces lanuginosus]|uniref:uncharacterized protein n=1 Tax=Thermomyces lanuginosus TaxID=5541 RepID=UPI003743ED45